MSTAARIPGSPAVAEPAARFGDAAARTRVIAALASRFGARLTTGEAARLQHGRGEGPDAGTAPDAVVWPESTAEVAEIVGLCAAERVPVIAHGAGTSLEGHVSAPFGGVCVDLTRMDRVLAVNAEDSDCVVQPGITREALNAHLRDTGLFFPVDPGANATLGGMISTRASGTTTLRYGSTWQNAMALEVVLADGRVIRCGTRARKSSAGYDLVRLFCGAEGTLGIVTELTLRLHPQPEEVGAAVCAFDTLRGAVDCVVELSQSGVALARMEFLDELTVRACNAYSQLSLAEKPTLMLEFHGTAATVREDAQRAEAVAKSHGADGFAWATKPEDRTKLWKARHSVYFAGLALRPGGAPVIADVCVPISALADAVAAAREDIDREGLVAPIVGHVGDGNFHVLFMLAPGDAAERARMDRVYSTMIDRAHAAGGTCTGEHGIGTGKQGKLVDEFGRDVVELMRATKRAFDPLGIMNPGKIFAA
jgi:D-lactate dehydrogenase (cytochrome)